MVSPAQAHTGHLKIYMVAAHRGEGELTACSPKCNRLLAVAKWLLPPFLHCEFPFLILLWGLDYL